MPTFSVILSTIFVILSVSEGSIASRFFVAEFTLSVGEGLLRITSVGFTLSEAKSLAL